MPSDPFKFKQAKEISRKDILLSVAREPDTGRLFVGSSDSSVHVVDLAAEKAEPVALEGHSGYVTGVAIAGAFVVSGAYDGKLIWRDRKTLKAERTHKAHDKWIRAVEASPDGKLIASVADDMVCRVWEVASGKMKYELRGHELMTPSHFHSMLYACAFSTDGAFLATGDKVGHIVVWDLASGKPIKTVESTGMYTWDPRARIHSIGGIRSLAFSPDNSVLAVGGMGKVGNIDHLEGKARLELFDWRAEKSTKFVEGDKCKGLITKLAFHPKGDWLVGAGGDSKGSLIFFDTVAGKTLREDTVPMHVHRFVTSESADRLYLVGHNKISIWELSA